MLWKFAAPGILSSLMNAAHNIVDQVFVGQGIGDPGIAATNIAFPLATITTALAGMLGMGGAKLGFRTALLKQIGLLLPLLLLLPLAFGIEGLFWAGPATDSLAAIVVIFLAAREVRALTKLHQEQTGETGKG
jgi:Na+-driven multidrug efflux pump